MSSARKGGARPSPKASAGAVTKQATQPSLLESVQTRLVKDVFESAAGTYLMLAIEHGKMI
jgi:hypothetical protein